jgi:hypothetical protein
MRNYLIVGAALSLSACGGGAETQNNTANMTASDNMMMDQNMAMDPMMNGTGNMAMDPTMNGTGNMAMDPMMNGTTNGAVDPATQNMMQKDMKTNDPDTNLANGL